jgi:hypothetical protein
MFKHHAVLPADTRRRALLVAVALVAPVLAGLGIASPAMASEPKGAFVVFKQCPRFTPGVNFCLFAQIEGGYVEIGKTKVPINEDKKHEIVLQGGIDRNEEAETETFVGALNGETLSKAPQNVPGGLTDLINCTEIKGSGLLEALARDACKAMFENKTTGVSATTELAKPASAIGIDTSNLINEEGVALSLPTKIHLENTFLGSECYIGSSASPVTFNLTDGTTSPPPPNKPISGKLGDLTGKLSEGLPYTETIENTLVDNSFGVPKASGCGGIFSSLIDPLVDAKLGLPSEPGHNTTVQNGKNKLATAEYVIASETK